jgi:putative PEP-CTERM system histidine kinase
MNLVVTLAFIGLFLGAVLSLMVLLPNRRTVVQLSLGATLLLLAFECLCLGISLESTTPELVLAWRRFAMGAFSPVCGFALLFSLTYARGNYVDFIKKWRPILIGAFAVPMLSALLFQSQLVVPIQSEANPDLWVMRLGWSGSVYKTSVVICCCLILMNLERTFRAAVGTMRWRIKFMILGVGLLFAVRAYTASQNLLFHAVDNGLKAIDLTALIVACLLISRTLFRAGHFEVAVYPSYAVLQNSITVTVAGIYFVAIGFYAKLVSQSGGTPAFPLKSLLILLGMVAVTLVALSDRVRLSVRRILSRYFQRPFHDYRTVWRTFTEGTASHVEQSALCNAVVKLTSDIFQVLSVNIWLLDPQNQSFAIAASTSLSPSTSETLIPRGPDAAEIIAALRQHQEPIDIDESREHWAVALRRCHPGEFRKGGNRICIPILARGELLGFMSLGDRVGGMAFSLQDFDLLKCVTDQVGANLLNIQLSQRLVSAREMEAFQTMSTFFVHDLKNTASTLSLMLQNLPVHFDNPAFREDALRAVGKTVNHINGLIGKLSMLRKTLSIKLVPADLNQVVSEALKCLEGTPKIRITTTFASLPPFPFDPEQIHSVVVNLAVNAREAMGQGGDIIVETTQQNSWAVLSIKDSGCGMAPEFISKSLFRPFQTTKKQGIGIGMFQCKMIVEAHRGRIEVESVPGEGSTFRVLLPIQNEVK